MNTTRTENSEANIHTVLESWAYVGGCIKTCRKAIKSEINSSQV
jgi:hypothetical protein